MHNSKASLFLMEIMMSILFFTIAAVVCIQLFVKAHTLNNQTENLANATMIAQNISECFLSSQDNNSIDEYLSSLPNYESKENTIIIYYDQYWNICKKEYANYSTSLFFEDDSDFATLKVVITDTQKNNEIFNHSLKKHLQRRAS